MDLAEENARLKHSLSRVSQVAFDLQDRMNALMMISEDDSIRPPIVEDEMWCVFGPSQMLCGSVFYRRRNAIAYAVETVGLNWNKARRMGYRCERIRFRTISKR